MLAIRGRGRDGDVIRLSVLCIPLWEDSPMQCSPCLSLSLRSDSKNIDSAPVHLGSKNVTVRFRCSFHTTWLSLSQSSCNHLVEKPNVRHATRNLKCYHYFWWPASSTGRRHSTSLARFSNAGVWDVNLCSLLGAAPKDYTKNEAVVLDVNALRPGLRYDDAKLVSLVMKALHNAMLIFHWLQQSLINCASLSGHQTRIDGGTPRRLLSRRTPLLQAC